MVTISESMQVSRQEMHRRREEWITALESGEYKQRKNFLRVGNEYCCFGVACELANIPQIKNKTGRYAYNGETQTPPVALQVYLGFTARNPVIKLNTQDRTNLDVMNDGGENFETIARTIRDHYRDIFILLDRYPNEKEQE